MSLDLWWRNKVTRFSEQSGSTPVHLAESQFLLLDIDTTGLDVRRDCANGIATLPLRDRTFRISDIRYVDLRLPEHKGLGGSADSHDQHDNLVEAVASHLVVTYNPRFVRQMISRTAGIESLALAGNNWIDLRSLLVGAFGTDMGDISSLKRWQQRMTIEVISEHTAVSDVVAMAQLLQMVLARCEERNVMTLGQLMDLKMSSDWLRGE